MIEIIPNWHPIFVHFTVALWSLAVVFHIVTAFLTEGNIRQQWTWLSRWNLWLGTGFGIITAIAGWFAYNSVAHDAQSHVAMTDHRNWALVTLGLFIILAGWSLWSEYNDRLPGKLFLSGLLIGGVLLAGTAWRGAEAVYRYGVGVKSLPKAENSGHLYNRDGMDGDMQHDHMMGKAQAGSSTKNMTIDSNEANHDHDH